ncbi:hypothetical protein HPB47_015227 [Ixodes persulcatus]|uniref:Uncharacterized protein n=1 Tax=Ixodes persulcatus TaxID=34615 RepID=A0AC60QU61_IXOPE|nr:hypothetical protein HPB47_015227 [Ixodes persulcatus]
MPTARECVCCLEVPKVASKAGNRCITDHSDFFGGILNPVVLQIAYRMRAMELNDMELIGQRSTHKKEKIISLHVAYLMPKQRLCHVERSDESTYVCL